MSADNAHLAGGMEREAKLVLVLVLLPLFATISAVELQKCVCVCVCVREACMSLPLLLGTVENCKILRLWLFSAQS